MRRAFLSLVFCLSSTISSAAYWQTAEFRELLDITGLDSTQAIDLDAIVALTEGSLWKVRGERFHPQELLDVLARNERRIFELARMFGFVDNIEPSGRSYDRVLVLGATAYRVRSRMNFAIEQTMKHDLIFGGVVFLGSTRDLSVGSDADKAIIPLLGSDFPHTEYGMIRYLWERGLTAPIPPQLRLDPIWVNALPSADNPRANLKDTVSLWLDLDKIESGMRVLMVSDQPHASSQHKTVVGILEQRGLGEVFVEAVGADIGERTENVRVLLDAIRRDLYLIQQNQSAVKINLQ
ncbi:MAG: hypothetical protein KA436_12260 [Oligoflexales bacterium]|nr:hypothetical protein [Oligoflexales bacterium]